MQLNSDQTRFESLLQIGRQLNRVDNFKQSLQEIADLSAELTQSLGSSILLFEEETHQLYYAAARSENREQLLNIRIPIENSLAGWVYHQGSSLKIPDNQTDPLILRIVEQSIESSPNTLLAVPITYRDETLGTLQVTNKAEKQPYTTGDKSTLESLASFAGTMIRMQYLNEREEKVIQEHEELKKQKSDFIAITSHELRTPLGLVLGHATFLNEIINDDFYQEQLEAIINNAERLKSIIDRLSQVKGFESGTARIRWQKIELNKLLTSVASSFDELAKEYEISLGMTIPEKPITIYCDAAKLSVAIGNLIKNGIIFSDQGQNVQIGLHKLPGHAHISVVDSGIGIPAKDIRHIFERFFQVEPHLTRTRGGMGLGLSVSKSIVESHGGYIWVESILGEGSTFTILLPTKDPTD